MLRKILLAAVVMGVICSTAFGAEETTTTFPGISSFEIMQDKLLLDDKGDDYVMFCRRRFDITTYTLIKDEQGMIIPFADLLVPCEALVSYYKKPGTKRRYIVVSIEVKGEPQPQPK